MRYTGPSKPVHAPDREIHPLSREEACQFLDVVSHDHLSALYALALASGMRESELLELHWSEVDFDASLVRVRWQSKREEGQWVMKQPKTRRSRPQIALSASTMEALRAHCTVQVEERLRQGPGNRYL